MNVDASEPLLQTSSASIGSAIESKQLDALPVLGGSFLNVLALSPGVVPVLPTGSMINFSQVSQYTIPSVFGERQKDNDYLMDGVGNRDPNFLGVAIFPPPAAIAEVKLDSGVGSSVFGHGSGATMNIVTKSGTNEWHGDLWEDFRNNALDATTYFLSSVGVYHWNQFGAAADGPIVIPSLISKKQGWYVFGSYEGVRISKAANYYATVPTLANLNGDFSASTSTIYDPYTTIAGPVRQALAGNVIPASKISATALSLAKAIYPTPNVTNGPGGANYLNTTPTTTHGDQWDVRVDHQFGHRDNIMARLTAANNPTSSVAFPLEKSNMTQHMVTAG